MLKPTHWHVVDSAAAAELTTITNTPGVVFGLSTIVLPQALKPITNVQSYYVSGYVNPQVAAAGFTVRGELLVARVDDGTTKNYDFLFAQGEDGLMYFAGPYKGYGHHVNSGQRVEVNSLFGQTPLSPKPPEAASAASGAPETN